MVGSERSSTMGSGKGRQVNDEDVAELQLAIGTWIKEMKEIQQDREEALDRAIECLQATRTLLRAMQDGKIFVQQLSMTMEVPQN